MQTAWIGTKNPGHLDPDNRRALAATTGLGTLYITHDLDGLDRVEEIVVLDRGRAAERGTHAELAQAGGLYQQMWQARGEPRPGGD